MTTEPGSELTSQPGTSSTLVVENSLNTNLPILNRGGVHHRVDALGSLIRVPQGIPLANLIEGIFSRRRVARGLTPIGQGL